MLMLIKLFLFLFLVSSAFADFADCTVVVGQPTAVAGCNPASNEVGDRNDSGDYNVTNNAAENQIRCLLYVADCTGTANTAMLYREDASDTDNCKMGLCDSADGNTDHSPATHDANCVWTSGNTYTSPTTGWQALTGDLGKSVTSGNYYWVCIIGGAGDCRFRYNQASGTRGHWGATGFTYSSPPANLNGTWTNVASRDRSAYVEID